MSRRIGRYEIQAELGRGGFGQVFRAYDPTVGRQVAIKTLTGAADPDLLRRFRNEAAAAGKLRHNNIVIIYDFGEHEGAPYLVMELLDGEDLERIISTERSLSLLQKLDIIAQAASGLHHAHAHGIVHRDVKPANIMLQHDGVVKIMDFGIALLSQLTAARITPKGSMIGTLPYMAPEQFQGSPSDSVTDIFAFGVTCYKLLTGMHPFHAEEMGGLMFNIVNKAPEPLRALSPECPEALEQTVLKMLAKDREVRYQTLEDVRFDLEPVIIELRKERVTDLLAEARHHIAANRLDKAQSMVREALDADPANRTARDLRETLQRQIRENEIRPRVAALIQAGREHLQARRFESAIQSLQSAIQLDKSNPELQRAIAEARAAWELAQRTGRILKDAQNSLGRGDLTQAHRLVVSALSIDPQNNEAESLQTAIQERLNARDRERRLAEGLSHSKRLMMLESFDQVIEDLQILSADYPESTAVRELLEHAREAKALQDARRRLHALIEQAKALLKGGRVAEAVDHLEIARKEFPESSELRDLAAFATDELRSQAQTRAVAEAISGARALANAFRYDEALAILQRTLAEYPAASSVRELIQELVANKGEHERRAALEDAIARTNALVGEQRFREAVERISAYVRGYGESNELEALRKQAEEGLDKQRRLVQVRKLVVDARAMLDEGRPDSATRVLQLGTTQFPGDAELVRLLDEAESRLREQKRAEAISKVISEAESLTRARQFDRALKILDEGLQEYGGAERLVRCREATVATQTRYARKQAQRTAVDKIQRLYQAGELESAASVLDSAIVELGEDAALLALRQQISEDQIARKRDVELRGVINKAQDLLGRGDLASATEMLDAATRRFPDDAALAEMRQAADQRVREQQKAELIGKAVSEAAAHSQAGRFDAAAQTLDAAVRVHGADAELVRAREAVSKAKFVWDREQALKDLEGRVRASLGAGRLDDALKLLEAGRKQHGNAPIIAELASQIEALHQARQREEAARASAKEAEDRLAREIERLARDGRYAEALDACERAVKEHPGTDRFLRLRDSVRQGSDRASALATARAMHTHGDFAGALQIIRGALQSRQGDQELEQFKARIEADQEQQRRSEAVSNALEQSGALVSAGRPEAAVALLRPVLTKYPAEARLAEALRRAEDEVRRTEREKQVDSVLQQAEALAAQQKFAEAIALLNDRFPGEPRFRDLLLRAQEQVDLQRRREARERARAQLLAIEQRIPSTRKSRLEDLRAESRQIAAAHREDVELTALAARIEQQLDAMVSVPAAPRRSIPWKTAGAGIAAVVVIAAAILSWPRISQRTPGPAAPQTGSQGLTIRTDPPGATVSLGDRSCTAPNCSFDLPAGRYKILARLNGYKPKEQTLDLRPGVRTDAILTLEPEPPPPVPTGSEKGTLIVRTGAAGVRVLVDNVPHGLTDARGELRAELETGSHTVRVEKGGYQTPPDQHVAITNKSVRPMAFKLASEAARLEIHDAPAGIEIRTATGQTGRTDSSKVFSMEVPSGDLSMQIVEGNATRQITRTFSPGATLALSWRDIAPAKVVPPSQPPQVTAEMREAQDWERVRNTSDPDQIETFLREHRGGAHESDAQSRLDDLVWSRSNQGDAASVQAYLTRFPRGTHARDAQKLLDDSTWAAVNKKDTQALQAFIAKYGSSVHKTEAQGLLDRLSRERQEAEDRRNQQQKVIAQEGQAIRAALKRFNDAFVHKSARELKQIWPSAPTDWLESMTRGNSYFVATLYPLGEPDVIGAKASIRCDLITQTILRGQPQPQNRKVVKATLQKTGDQWIIDDPRGPA